MLSRGEQTYQGPERNPYFPQRLQIHQVEYWHRKVNRRRQRKFWDLCFTPFQLERYRAKFEWPAISFRGIRWMAFRGVGGGTGWLWDRG